MSATAQPDFLNIIISRQQTESGDISSILPILSKMWTPEAAIQFRERLDIAVYGTSTEVCVSTPVAERGAHGAHLL